MKIDISLGTITFLIILAFAIYKMTRPGQRIIERYKSLIKWITIGMIPMAVINIMRTIADVQSHISLTDTANDPTGLSTLLNISVIFATPFLLMLGILAMIVAYGVIALILWIIYWIWEAIDKKQTQNANPPE